MIFLRWCEKRGGREEYKASPKLINLNIYKQFAPTCKQNIHCESVRSKFYALFTLKQQIYVGEGEGAALRRFKRGYQRKSITRALWRRIGQLPFQPLSARTGIPLQKEGGERYCFLSLPLYKESRIDVINNNAM